MKPSTHILYGFVFIVVATIVQVLLKTSIDKATYDTIYMALNILKGIALVWIFVNVIRIFVSKRQQ
jgi:hypothetical protein